MPETGQIYERLNTLIGKKVELLAPAGSFDSLKGAVHAGADAVYMGGALFSARAYAENPDDEGLSRSVEYCHFYGRKLYLALNTLLKQNEIDTLLYDFVSKAYDAGIDAVIVQDLGVMRFINEKFPMLPIHISTQASVMTPYGAEYLKKEIPSITRVVPARELSLEELKHFRNETDLEMEVFVHGALCVCYSGMCLMSSYIGERSGNRGRCAQPCRKLYEAETEHVEAKHVERKHGDPKTVGIRHDDPKYGESKHVNPKYGEPNTGDPKQRYFLSPKDQCLLDDIPELIEAGIDSFKIEGRMKSPEYTAGTVAVYRKKIDEASGNGEIYRPFINEMQDKDILMELYNRGGFNLGYLHRHNGDDMMSMTRPNHSGVLIGKVERTKGREAVIKLIEDVYAHDVLEIRHKDERKVFEFTTGEAAGRGSVIKTVTMKDSRAIAGDEVYRTRCEKLLCGISDMYLKTDLKLPVDIEFSAHKGAKTVLRLILHDKKLFSEIYSEEAAPAAKSPATSEGVSKQLTRLGDTSFTVADVRIDIDSDLFLPVSQLNNMRREAAEKLYRLTVEANKPKRGKPGALVDTDEADKADKADKAGKTDKTDKSDKTDKTDKSDKTDKAGKADKAEGPEYKLTGEIFSGKPFDDRKIPANEDKSLLGRIFASCWDNEQLKTLFECGINEACINMCDLNTEKIDEAVEIAGGAERIVIGLPYASRNGMLEKLKEYIGTLSGKYPDIRFMVRNFDELGMIRRYFPQMIDRGGLETDYMPYLMNNNALITGAKRVTLSNELEISEIRELITRYDTAGSEKPCISLIIYGYQPSMISAQCVYKNIFGKCMKQEGMNTQAHQKGNYPAPGLGSYGNTFMTKQLCEFCTNIIYNSACHNNIDKIEELSELAIDRFRLDLTCESPDEIRKIINRVRTGRGSVEDEKPATDRRYTRGHLFRKTL